jgi:hypothetical protein
VKNRILFESMNLSFIPIMINCGCTMSTLYIIYSIIQLYNLIMLQVPSVKICDLCNSYYVWQCVASVRNLSELHNQEIYTRNVFLTLLVLSKFLCIIYPWEVSSSDNLKWHFGTSGIKAMSL